MTIQVFNTAGAEIAVAFSTFPGGEEHVRVDPTCAGKPLIVEARLTSSMWVMRLVMLADALTNLQCKYALKVPYLPYGRQDRVCNPGEAEGVWAIYNFKIEAIIPKSLSIRLGNYTHRPLLVIWVGLPKEV